MNRAAATININRKLSFSRKLQVFLSLLHTSKLNPEIKHSIHKRHHNRPRLIHDVSRRSTACRSESEELRHKSQEEDEEIEDDDHMADKEPINNEPQVVHDGSDNIVVALTNPQVFDCSICYEPLTIPVFQCDKNGYLACVSCCSKSTHAPGQLALIVVGESRRLCNQLQDHAQTYIMDVKNL